MRRFFRITCVVILLLTISLLSISLLNNNTQERKDGIQPNVDKIRVAFSHSEGMNPWTTDLIDSFVQAAEPENIELIYHVPMENTAEWQLNDLALLLDYDIDYLVIFPKEANVLDATLEKAWQKNVPVILISRQAHEEKNYTVIISTDYVMEGRICAQLLAEKFQGKACNIVEIKGPNDSSIATDRSKGFYDELKKYPNMHVVAIGNGNFDRLTAQYAMENIIINSPKDSFNAVFACSDEDGLGVLQALKLAGFNPGEDIGIVSINGIQDVLKAIVAGEYTATVESSPKIGYVAFDMIAQLERGYRKSGYVVMPYEIFDGRNAQRALSVLY
jgi:ABC-type sugar transport system substrate-binding protein